LTFSVREICSRNQSSGGRTPPEEESFPSLSTTRRFPAVKVFVQAKNDSVVINDEIIVTVLDIDDEEVVLAVDAPEWVRVSESEAFEAAESVSVHPR
jgi:carbon storage regulator CsrA